MANSAHTQTKVTVKVAYLDFKGHKVGFKIGENQHVTMSFKLLIDLGYPIAFLKKKKGSNATVNLKTKDGRTRITHLHDIAGQPANQLKKGAKGKNHQPKGHRLKQEKPKGPPALPVGTVFATVIPESLFENTKRPFCFCDVSAVRDGDRWDGEVNFAPVHLHMTKLNEELAMQVSPDTIFTCEVVEGQKSGQVTALVIEVNTDLFMADPEEPAEAA